ncbi:hypothetical protein D3C86_2002820 [compost metagenome]
MARSTVAIAPWASRVRQIMARLVASGPGAPFMAVWTIRSQAISAPAKAFSIDPISSARCGSGALRPVIARAWARALSATPR